MDGNNDWTTELKMFLHHTIDLNSKSQKKSFMCACLFQCLICHISIICMLEKKTERTHRRALIRCVNILHNCCSFGRTVNMSVCLCACSCWRFSARSWNSWRHVMDGLGLIVARAIFNTQSPVSICCPLMWMSGYEYQGIPLAGNLLVV